jgi:hypothetical protein
MVLRGEPTAIGPVEAGTFASSREHLGTVLFGLWMTVGLFLDGYFHQNLDTDGESFLTPWHAVFYSGFAATLWWLAAMARRRGGPVDWRLSPLPPGYGGARAGVLLFAAGAVGDAAWHTAFGVERGIDALLSPTHLLLFSGLLLVLTSPLRAARAAPWASPSPWVVAGSLISATALVGFFLNFAWGLGIAALSRVEYDPVSDLGEIAVIAGVASTLVATAVLFAAGRMLAVIGPPPRAAVAALFSGTALLVSAAFDEDLEGVVAAIAAGVLLDVAVRQAGHRPWMMPAAFAATAAVMWATYFGLLIAGDGIEWQAEIWIGAVVLNALLAVGIALVPIAARPSTIAGTPT